MLLPLLALLGAANAASLGAFVYDTTRSPSTTTTASVPPATVTIYPAGTDGEAVIITGKSNAIVDNYYGIPFAAPPTGDLRFAPPQDPVWTTRALNATRPPAACLQAPDPRYSTFGTSEDCLYLNVQVPRGANAQTAFLPVMVWVYGGSFTSGAATYYDGTAIVAESIAIDQPVIYVSINYRLGALGFLNGAEASANGASNLGLKDVQKALEWVQQNIWGWGGDPSRVTVFGQSAGSILISLLYLQPNISLFSGAIMESGVQSTSPIGPTSDVWQRPYDLLVQFAGCGTTAANGTIANSSVVTNSSAPSFDCLKNLPAEQILAAQQQVRNISIYSLAFVFSPSVDGDIIPASPHDLLANGSFAKIPFITGNVRDEATVFLPASLPYANTTFIAGALSTIEPSGLPVDVLLQLFTSVYSPNPAAGSPFDTGNATFGLAPAYKQAAAILGDAAFQAPRRWFVEQAQVHGMSNETWNYLWNAAPPGAAPRLGVYHASEVFYVFGLPLVAAAVNNSNPIPLSPSTQAQVTAFNFTAPDAHLSQQVLQYWLNFAYYGNPNGDPSNPGNATYWPPYNGTEINLLNLGRGNVSVGKDDYRTAQMEYFLQRPMTFNYKRAGGED